MYGSIESTHAKINDKISLTESALEDIKKILDEAREGISVHRGKRRRTADQLLDSMHINIVVSSLQEISMDYSLAIASVLTDYYEDNRREEKNTRAYYRIITGENFVSKINDVVSKARSFIGVLHELLATKIIPRAKAKEIENQLDAVARKVERAGCIEVNTVLEKLNYEICKCGARMTVIPEFSELHCPTCARIKTIIGAVFRDDQFYPQEGQKTKHGGYDTSRHYRFWMERLQALETKVFLDSDLAKIEYVLERDGYDRKTLNCETIRTILKDSKVAATYLNDHAPLLVKTFGGPAPPLLTFQENKIISIRFNKVMRLYDIVNPSGGNKPYYPYFIYKIIEYEFRNNPEKLRLRDYIHLQSRETVIKNDKYYEQICALADDEDGLVYTPTDSSHGGL